MDGLVRKARGEKAEVTWRREPCGQKALHFLFGFKKVLYSMIH